ncbi:hypothetical protein [Quatrionicoccus australiensis]|uniref:hypothetical protein n=1 Tax=Quatrionicoccus australiensis TaxID=138118 RepID=UPI001CFA761D|nr:hypothetical protein [Quatrionicoccus australiensis]MCB4359569.1 hypothetical protein [Quatrionicoccus australiensis]
MIDMQGQTKQAFEELLDAAIDIKEQTTKLAERKKLLAETLGTKAGVVNAILSLAIRERDKRGQAINESRNVADGAEAIA